MPLLCVPPNNQRRRPKLGIFNDVPHHKFRETEALCWARAGFDVVINDGEHSLREGVYGREENAVLSRLGLTPVQRLPREGPPSYYGDVFMLGARGVMKPYSTCLDDLEELLTATSYPSGRAEASRKARGACPVRQGDGTYVPDGIDGLRAAEADCMPWFQFETTEVLYDESARRDILRRLAVVGGAAFVGAFDLTMRATEDEKPQIADAIAALFHDAKELGCPAGGIFGDPTDAVKAVASVKEAIAAGAVFIVVPYQTSDLPYVGAETAARPFFDALAEIFGSSSGASPPASAK
mmetsp:Transcript_9775/g.39763  ORF Transcript_9775/g.39763 Transcript_9775/m.39763 type:complete len:295 (-) Transcript_9775:1193-2077(-)